MQKMSEGRLSPRKVGKAILVASILVLTALSPVIVMPMLGSSTQIGDHDISFVNHTYDSSTDISTWVYSVTSKVYGTGHAISHWVLELGGCFSEGDIHNVSDNVTGEYPQGGDGWEFGDDPATNTWGLKIGDNDEEYDTSPIRIVSIRLYGNYPKGNVQITIKDGGGNSSGYVTGPVCPFADVAIEKRVWDEDHWDNSTQANVGDTVRFNISIHNTGNENLVDINVTDYLPTCLEYAAGNATIEPDVQWGRNLSWMLYPTDDDDGCGDGDDDDGCDGCDDGNDDDGCDGCGDGDDDDGCGECCCEGLSPGKQTYIEFDAIVISCGININVANVSAVGKNTCMSVHDEDNATVNVICNPNIDLEKTVWNEHSWDNSTRANVGDTVRFNISVHNTGNEPLTDINVTDYLPECLQYIADSATVNGSPQEPSMWGRNLSWEISGPLAPCNWVYIEFNATVIPEIKLPDNAVGMKVFDGSNSYFWTRLYNVPPRVCCYKWLVHRVVCRFGTYN